MARPDGPRRGHDAAATHAGRRRDRLAGGVAGAARRAAGRLARCGRGVGRRRRRGPRRRRAPRRGAALAAGAAGAARERAWAGQRPGAGAGGSGIGRRRRAPGSGRALLLEATRRARALAAARGDQAGRSLLGGAGRARRRRGPGSSRRRGPGPPPPGRGRARRRAAPSWRPAPRRGRGPRRRVRLGGRGGLLGGLLGLAGLFRLHVADEALALRLAADAVGLRVLDARGVRLDADPQAEGEVERLLVRHAELFGELVHTQLRCQVLGSVLHRGKSTAVHPRTNPQVGTIRSAVGARPSERGRGRRWPREVRQSTADSSGFRQFPSEPGPKSGGSRRLRTPVGGSLS